MPESPRSDDPDDRSRLQRSTLGATVEIALLFVMGTLIVIAGIGASLWASQIYQSQFAGAGLGETAAAGMVVMQVVVIVATLMAARLHGPTAWTLRLGPVAGGARSLRTVAIVGAVFLAVSTALAFFVYPETFRHDLETFRPLLESPLWWAAVLAVAVGAPVSEEVLFRGYLLAGFGRAGMPFVPAAVLTAAAWTVLHIGYSVTGLAEVFVAGLLLAWIMRLTDSLWVPIAVHALYNIAALAIMYIVIM